MIHPPVPRYLLAALLVFSLLLAATPALARLVPHTGQTQCYDNEKQITCPRPGQPFYGQDGNHITNPRSYTKLGHGGVELPDTALQVDEGGPWIMTRDNVTGLMWELKRNKDGVANYANPHDADNTYTWYDPTDPDNPGEPGNGNHTQAFIDALNAARFGGYADWRMPSVRELGLLVNSGRIRPAVDSEWFPNTIFGMPPLFGRRLNAYWSSSASASSTHVAWVVSFLDGYDGSGGFKSSTDYVRAVRGGQSGSFDDLIINDDGTVTDPNTGLMWQQETAPNTYTWQDALAYTENLILAGYTDWRLPNINELKTLVDYTRYDPAVNAALLEDTASSWYWSSTPHASNTSSAWVVSFYYGIGNYGYKAGSGYARAVREGQSDIRSFGNLILSIEPAEARVGDAQWRRVGTRTWFKHNDLETGVPPGEHEIEFSRLDDWRAPEGVTVSVRAGERTRRTASYTQQTLDDSRRAAIVVLTRGKGRTDMPGIDFMALHAYNALLQRQYRQDEIYLLAYYPYFDHRRYEFGMPITVNAPVTLEEFRNGTADRDITVDDIRQAFNWAATKGTLNDPLLFKFVGHGLRDGGALHLDPNVGLLRGTELNVMIGDYQRQTGNNVVVVLEACYSGTHLPLLAGNNRVVITSAGDHQAGFTLDTPAGMGSFSRLLFSELRIGSTWRDAFKEVAQKLPNLQHDFFKEQKPQLDDNGDGIYDDRDGLLADRHRINNNLGLSSLPVSLTPLVTGRSVQVNERVELRVNVGPGAHQVWASVVTPETSVHLETSGYPLKSAVAIPLSRIPDSAVWQGAFNGFHHRGDYTVTFFARDMDGFVTSSGIVDYTLPHGPEATAAPVPFRTLYRPGDQVQIRIPYTPEGYRAVVALSVPGIADLLVLRNLNDVAIFDGIHLPLWHSSDSLVVDLPVATGLPEGIYTAFLLHVPVGVERVEALSGAKWRMGQATFEITYRERED